MLNITLPNLENGTVYDFHIRAVNSLGAGTALKIRFVPSEEVITTEVELPGTTETFQAPADILIVDVEEGDIYTPEQPLILDHATRDTVDSVGDDIVEVRVPWSGVTLASSYEVERTFEDVIDTVEVETLEQAYTQVFPAADSQLPRLISYRVRGVAVGGADDSTLDLLTGRRVKIPAGATVYSPWSYAYPVTFRAGGGLRVDFTSVEDGINTKSKAHEGVREVVTAIREFAGITPGAQIALEVLAGFALAGLVFVVVMLVGGLTALAIFGGAAAGALVLVTVGTTLFGIPWGMAAFPLALVAVVGLVLLKNRGISG